MRRVRRLAGSDGECSIFELLVGFMAKSFVDKIDLCVTSKESLRLDKTLTKIIPEKFGFSRARVQQLITSGAVSDINGKLLTDPASKAYFGLKVSIRLPLPDASALLPEKIELEIIYEDADLLVVNKPAGMVVHPAPGTKNGTLVNALLFHCGSSLSGVGGIKRPGIVHRIDKDTSGLLVAAKTDLAHNGLANQFVKHNVERKYLALVYGCPSKLNTGRKNVPGLVFEPDHRIKISTKIGRHKFDRKKMAVHLDSGRDAITRFFVKKDFVIQGLPVASLIECQLETGRTHQIRVHLHHLRHGIIGDQTYRSQIKQKLNHLEELRPILKNFKRQALHATTLGFCHPRTGKWLSFSSKMPNDMVILHRMLDLQTEKL